MATKKISEMDAATTAAGDELVPIVQSGANKKITVTNLTAAKVDKVTGKSLVADTEISKIHELHADDQDLTGLLNETSHDLLDHTGLTGVPAALGYTAEDAANKKTVLTDNSDTYYPSQKAVKTAVDSKQDLITANYITVDVSNDAKINGASLIAAYTAAKALTPNGTELSATNRACVILPPGNYDLDHGKDDACVPLTLDTEFVDIIGLTTDRSLQHIYGTPPAADSGVIVQTANDVHISNLTVEILTTYETPAVDNTDSAAYFPSTNLSETVIDNVDFVGKAGGSTLLWSMRIGVMEYSGTFTSCTGGDYAFGGEGTASGTFTSCTGGEAAFGSEGTASGTFNYCIGGDYAFGCGGTASGTFTSCTGGDYAFGGDGTPSGTFNYCIGGDYAFGGSGTPSGTFNYCIGGDYAFGGYDGTASGIFTNCTGGDFAFGGYGTASGIFTNCTGGDYAFGGYGGTASGTFTGCTGGDYAFGSEGTASGTFISCTGGDYAFAGGGGSTASGTFTSCIGGDYAFGGYGGTASGTFISCTGGDYAFAGGGGSTASGTFTSCTGGDYAFGGSMAA